MRYVRMPIEIESPEQMGYDAVKFNLTESSFSDTLLGDLDLDLSSLLLCYGDHFGHPKLRQLIAQDAGVSPENVLLTTGAAGALFIIATSLLEKGDHILVEHPNYATNIETPRAIGAKIDFIPLTFENQFRPNPQDIQKLLKNNPRYVSLTVPHNPTGTLLSLNELQNIITQVEQAGSYLLVDETYRDMAFDHKLPVAASLSDKVISVCSLSKTYGLPGIRIGWIVCRDAKLMETFLAAKEQMTICGSVVDEEIAYRFWLKRETHLPKIQSEISKKFSIIKDWFNSQNDLEWVEPRGGVVCFPRFKKTVSIQIDRFYSVLNQKYQTFVGPGHWFEMDRRFFRIGFGWPKTEELKQGLEHISKAIRETI